MDKITRGQAYLKQAHRSMTRDFDSAFAEEDWNIAVRRAQEAVEYAVKALYLLLGQDPPKVHNPYISADVLRDLPTIAFADAGGNQSTWYVKRAAGVHGEALGLYEIRGGIWTQRASCSTTYLVGIAEPLVLVTEPSAVYVTAGEKKLLSLGFNYGPAHGHWEQKPISEQERLVLVNYVEQLSKQRLEAFYFEAALNRDDAEQAWLRAWLVLESVIGNIGQGVA